MSTHANPIGRLTAITGSLLSAATGPTSNSAAMARNSEINNDAGIFTACSISRRTYKSRASVRRNTQGIAMTFAHTVITPSSQRLTERSPEAKRNEEAESSSDCVTKKRTTPRTCRVPTMAKAQIRISPALRVLSAPATDMEIACMVLRFLPANENAHNHRAYRGDKSRSKELADPEEPQFRQRGFNDNQQHRETQNLDQNKRDRCQYRTEIPAVSKSPGSQENVQENASQHKKLHLPAPLHKCRAATRKLQSLGFVDHRQFEMPGGIVHGNPAPFGKNQHQERNEQQYMRGRKENFGILDPPLLHDVWNRGLRNERHGEENDHEHWLGQESDHPCPAGAHRAVGVPCVHRRQRREETSEPQEKHAGQHVPHERKRQRIIRQHRNQYRHEYRADKDKIRGDPKDPGGLGRYDFVLVKQLPEVAVRLKNAGSSFALHHLLQTGEYSRIEGRENQHEQNLDQIERDCLLHPALPPPRFREPSRVIAALRRECRPALRARDIRGPQATDEIEERR